VTMSTTELNRLRIIEDLISRRTTPKAVAGLLGITRRQVRRLRTRYVGQGAAGLVSLRRGKPSNRKLPAPIRQQVLDLVRERYSDFGPTLATEKLQELHGFTICPETMRQWMKAESIWLDRKARQKPVYQPRYRRECPGELVQIDGSEHWWFEDRGPQCTLLVYIDDATSKLMQLKFVESESAFAYFASTREYLERHGKPLAFYSDKHSIFRVARKGAIGGDGMTQFGRALHELNIDIICAHTPQAKGRVERANRTLQDRLVKELRLQGINSIEAGNELLPAFLADYNARFAKEPRNPKDLHRPLASSEDLGDVFAWREERTVSAALTVQYDKVVFLLEPNEVTRGLIRKRITISDYSDGRVVISHNGLPLPYRIFDKVRQVDQGAIVDNKRLSAVLAQIKVEQELRPQQRSQAAPMRRSQENSIFSMPAQPPRKLRGRPGVKKAPKPTEHASDQPTPAASTPEIDARPQLSMEDELCLAIGQRVREEQLETAAALRLVQDTANDRRKPDAPLLADPNLPEIVGDFRLFNRYVIQKRPKRPVQGRCRRKQHTQPISQDQLDTLPVSEGRLSTALALAEIYKQAA